MSEPEKKPSSQTDVIFWVMAVCVLVLFTWAVMPNFSPSRYTRTANACINNLRQIDAAANMFALEHSKTNGEAINYPNDLTPYMKLPKDGKIPPCPKGGIYSIKKVGDTPTCSIGTTVNPPHVLP